VSSPIEVTAISVSNVENADLLICACGFETRATAVAKLIHRMSKKRLAIGFPDRQVLSYLANRKWFDEHEFEIHTPRDSGFRQSLSQSMESSIADLRNESCRIAVDVSCFNRLRLAHIVNAVQCLPHREIQVDFLYTLASYSPPSEGTAPTTVAEPVIPQFAGWRPAPEKPTAAIVGLGYEANRAMGIVDYLEVDNAAWTFCPVGPIDEYTTAVELANESLLVSTSFEGRNVRYRVDDPFTTFLEMDRLTSLLKQRYNPLLIPFGPKIFSLISLLVASKHEEVGVWRVSSGESEVPVDRLPSEHVIALRVLFRNEP
jgi:hypothetical protein